MAPDLIWALDCMQIEQSLIPGVSGGFVTYRVATQTRLPGFANNDMAVRRRFRDFVVGFGI